MAEQDINQQLEKVRKFIRSELQASQDNARLDVLYQQILLQQVFGRPEPLAAMTSWSVAPEFVWWLYQHVTSEKPQKIMELGSGTSTIAIAAALKKNGGGRLISVEHDQDYLEKTGNLLSLCGLESYVELVYAPLEPINMEGQTYRWYSLPYDMLDHVIGRGGLDLLLIDGPPAATNRHARLPALPLLQQYCHESTVVLLDDAGREEEQAILKHWQAILDNELVYHMLPAVRHGPALLYLKSKSGKDSRLHNAIEGSVRDRVKEDIAALLQKTSTEAPGAQRYDVANAIAEYCVLRKENSLHEWKAKYSAVSEQCQQLEEKLEVELRNTELTRKSVLEGAEMTRGLELENAELTRTLGLKDEQLEGYRQRCMEMKSELRKRDSENRLVYKSLVYQLGLALYKNTRKLRSWIKIPLAVYRVKRRHARSGAPDLVEYRTLVGEETTLNGYSPSLNKTINGMNKNSVLWVASQVADELGYEAAIAFSEKYVSKVQRPGVCILRANACLDSDVQWLKYFNDYLKPFGIEPVGLAGGEGGRFSRLQVAAPLNAVDGPMISVIMPAFNAEATLRHAANSILAQTWRNLELIIVDDCSTDATWNIAQELSRQDSRVTALRNVANVGPYVSKNLALRMAKGDYISGQDADDWSHPQRLEREVGPILDSSGQVLATLSAMVRMNAEGEFSRFSKIGRFSKDGVRRVASISLLIDAKTLRNLLGGWDSVRFGADSELINRVEKILGSRVKRTDNVGMFCLDLDTSLTNDPTHGVSQTTGISPTRREYRESYMHWHQQVTEQSAYMPFPHVNRKYPAPGPMLVALDAIEKNIAVHEQMVALEG